MCVCLHVLEFRMHKQQLQQQQQHQKERATSTGPLVNKNINELIKNELIFSSSSNNSSNFGNVIRKCNESSSVDLPDETVSNSSGSSLCFDSKHNRMSVSGGGGGPSNKNNRRINKRSNAQFQTLKQTNVNRSSDSSEKSLNSMTISDLDTKNSNQPESKLLRKKFIKCILREDVYVLVGKSFVFFRIKNFFLTIWFLFLEKCKRKQPNRFKHDQRQTPKHINAHRLRLRSAEIGSNSNEIMS